MLWPMKILDVPKSGSKAAETASRNRYGQYLRTRATPVNPNSTAQGAARTRLAVSAAAWRTLTAEQRAGWASLGSQMQRTDGLGQTYTLTGFQAYVSVNNVRLNTSLLALDDAPALDTPDAPTAITVEAEAGTLGVTFAVTPLPANTRLIIEASPQRSAGRDFEGDFRQVLVSGTAAVSPLDCSAGYTAKFGAPVAGNKIFIRARTARGGFLSGPVIGSAVVTAP